MKRSLTTRSRPISASLFLSSILFIAGPIGCGDLLKQPAPAKALFSIEPGAPDAAASPGPATAAVAIERVLQVRPLRVSPPFDGVSFVYQTAPSQFAFDYYNNFVASPSALLTNGLMGWLEKSGPLRVVGAGSSIQSDLVLECEVNKLLIDFSDPTNPQAVIDARFLLYSDRTTKAAVLLDRSYVISRPLLHNSPAGYSSAWGIAFREILKKLEVDICHSLTLKGNA